MFESIFEDKISRRVMNRRVFLSTAGAAIAGVALYYCRESMPVEAGAGQTGPPKMVFIVAFSASGVRQGVVEVPEVVKSDREWQKQLSPAAFDITRRADMCDIPLANKTTL